MGFLEKMKLKRENVIISCIVLAMTIALAVMCFFINILPTYAKILICVGSVLSGIACIVFSLLKFEKTYKLIFLALAFVLMLAIIFLCLQATGFLQVFYVDDANVENKNEIIKQNLKAYLETQGAWMIPIYIALQFLQTIILPIPSFVITGAGTMLFGIAKGSLFGLLGIVAGSLLAFIIGRKVGHKLVVWIVGKDALIKMLEKLRGRDTVVLTLMFLLPFFPDDILCFIAGLSNMNFWYFTVVIVISKVLIVFSTGFLFKLLPPTEIWALAIWAILIAITVVIFVIAFKNGKKIDDFVRTKILRQKKSVKTEDDFAQKIIDQIKNDDEGDNMPVVSSNIEKSEKE